VFLCTFNLLLSFVGRNSVVSLQPFLSLPNSIALSHVSRFMYQSTTAYQISSRTDVHSSWSFIDHPCAIELCNSRINHYKLGSTILNRLLVTSYRNWQSSWLLSMATVLRNTALLLYEPVRVRRTAWTSSLLNSEKPITSRIPRSQSSSPTVPNVRSLILSHSVPCRANSLPA
jgi:hypothetical protein